jgi:hypothetical protein
MFGCFVACLICVASRAIWRRTCIAERLCTVDRDKSSMRSQVTVHLVGQLQAFLHPVDVTLVLQARCVRLHAWHSHACCSSTVALAATHAVVVAI